MHQKERIEYITQILEKNGYVTVKYLTEELDYSTATINRDLNLMKKQRLVKRSYGGVELAKTKQVPLLFRYNKMRPAKNKIGKRAAELISDGDTIFIDASTTAQYIGKFITDKKNITIITNNMALVSFLSEYNIQAICLGGKVYEPPSMLYSDETLENTSRYFADKMFFSTSSIYDDGKIGETGAYYLMHKAMAENSSQVYLMIDHDKINLPCTRCFGSLEDVTGIITDYHFPQEIKEKYKDTLFIEVD